MKRENVFNNHSIILPIVIGVFLGIAAKLVDVPEITGSAPILDDIMGRFGVWIWAASLIAVFSDTPFRAAVRSFAFFAGMLSAYYGYTVLFLHFFPKSQIILWGCIAMITPFCGFLIWHAQTEKRFANLIASFPFVIFFTEWYLTAEENLLLGMVYLSMAFTLLAAIPTNRKRLYSLLYGSVFSVLLVWLIQTGTISNLYDHLLNI